MNLIRINNDVVVIDMCVGDDVNRLCLNGKYNNYIFSMSIG